MRSKGEMIWERYHNVSIIFLDNKGIRHVPEGQFLDVEELENDDKGDVVEKHLLS